MKPLLGVAATLGLLSVGAFAYGALGPWYDPTPFEAPISFSEGETQTSEFSVQRSGDYGVEVQMLRNLPQSLAERLIRREPTKDEAPPLLIAWSIRHGEKPVSEGSSREPGSSPFWGSKSIGLSIGRVPLERSQTYTLSVNVGPGGAELERADPRVLVRLHPADLEYLVVLRIMGAAGTVFSIGLLGVVGLIRWRERRAGAPARA